MELAVALAALFKRVGAPRPWHALHQALTAPANAKRRADALLGLVDELRIDAGQREGGRSHGRGHPGRDAGRAHQLQAEQVKLQTEQRQRFEADLGAYTAAMELARRKVRATDMTECMRVWGTSPSYKLMAGLREFTGETAHQGDAPTGANEHRVAMAFWLRRQLDGTHRAFFDIRRQTMRAYGALPPGELPALDDR